MGSADGWVIDLEDFAQSVRSVMNDAAGCHPDADAIHDALILLDAADIQRRKNRGNAMKLGDRVRDKVTGFEGILTESVRYLTGCDQFQITHEADDSGDVRTLYVDIMRIEVIEEDAVVIPQAAEVPASG